MAIALGKLWLVGGQRLTAYGVLTIDDQWFVERAADISAGRWLGPFRADTLIKQPGYPIFVAAMHRLHLPLLLAQQLLYIGAAALVVLAARPVLPTRARRLAVFAIVVFNPLTMHAPLATRPDRSALYPALLLALLACLVGMVHRAGSRAGAWWAVGAAASLAAVWWTREEWVLVAPAVAISLAGAALRLWRSGTAPPRMVGMAASLAIVPLVIPISTWSLRAVNHDHYGLAVTNVEQTSMAGAIGAMTRVAPITAFVHYPVTVETRRVLYGVSPALRRIADELERGVGQRFATRRPDGVVDIPGDVFMWSVLDALDATGQATSAPRLAAAFAEITADIDHACTTKRLRCGEPHSGIAPAWRWSLLPGLAKRTVVATRHMLDLGAFSATSPPSSGSPSDLALFARITGEPLAPTPATFVNRLRVVIIETIRWIYRIAAVAAAAVIIRRLRVPRRLPGVAVAFAGLAATLFAARAAGLAWLDLTVFPALSPSYLASGYAVALAAAAVLCVAEFRPVPAG